MKCHWDESTNDAGGHANTTSTVGLLGAQKIVNSIESGRKLSMHNAALIETDGEDMIIEGPSGDSGMLKVNQGAFDIP